MAKRGSEWISFLRALAILKRLREGPATNEQLIQAVLQTVGRDAYPYAPQARQAAFKHDRTHLKNRLKVHYHFSTDLQTYQLDDAGPYGYISLSEEMLRAIALLSRQYDNAFGEMAGMRELVQQIVQWLSPEARREIDGMVDHITLDFEQDVDRSVIPQKVWDKVEKALQHHRKLVFSYLSPRYADRQVVLQEIAPSQLRFQDGHWYLQGYDLRNSPTDRETAYRRFRMSYILDDERLRVSPTKIEMNHRVPPRFQVHYLLFPEIGRGEISHRFPETKITRNPDGSAEVHAITDNVWEAARKLLAYGDGCVVLGGVALRQEMEKWVRGVAKNYSIRNEDR